MKSLKGPMLFISASMFLNFVGLTIILPVIPFLVSKYAPSSQVGLYVGLIMSAYAFFQFFAAPVLGAASDRFGRRPVLLFSLFGSAVGYIVFGIGGALWVLFLGRIIDGITGGNISTIYAYVADISEPKDRGRLYGILGAAGGFGFMVGPVIGSVASAISLTAPLYVAALVTILNICWGYFALPESLPKEKRTKKFELTHLNPFSAFSHVITSNVLRILFLASFTFFIAGTALQSNLSVFLKDVLSFGPFGIGAVFFSVGVMDIVSQGFLTPRLLPVFGEKKLAIAGLFINALGLLLIGLVSVVPSVILLSIGIIIFNLGDGLFQPAINSQISAAAPQGAQGRIQGANQGMQSVARILGPLMAAGLYLYGASLPYIGGAFLIGIGTIILLSAGVSSKREPL